MSVDGLTEGDFVQYRIFPGKLLGQIDKHGPTMCRLHRLAEPIKTYMNPAGVRTIEVEVEETGPEGWLWVHTSEIERWVNVG